ncbi:MAG: phenylacetate-CoA oxygenase subunit PaaC [Saprospiraceae bacterium]|nr:phenylacetate-CoA oxygenase subunit PaaC [Saprospiraceae bacterium]
MSNGNPLLDFILIHADNSLILSQRLSEWCGHGPVLEQDMAMTNIALDHIGRARLLYQYASELDSAHRSEDVFAFMRDEMEYKNVLLAEYPNTDFAFTVMRQFLIDSFYIEFFEKMNRSADTQLAHIADKSLKETQYHYKWSRDWVIRLGDGTELSQQKIQTALDRLWEFQAEITEPSDAERTMMHQNIAPDYDIIKSSRQQRNSSTFAEARLNIPSNPWQQAGGKKGYHTEHFGFLLAEMQYMQRAYPGLEW